MASYWRGHAYISGRTSGITEERPLGEAEEGLAGEHMRYLDDKYSLLRMKEVGLVRNRDVAQSWSEKSWPFDPVAVLGGAQWLRVVTEPSELLDGARPSGRRVSELALNDCLRGSLDNFAPLVMKLHNLRILHLHDNPNLTGLLETLHFSSLALLEQLSLQRTDVETKKGLVVLSSNQKLTYIDVTGCIKIRGIIPDQLLTMPGLRINLVGSGMADEDLVGNDVRERARGSHRLARVPGAP
jgi:hypothetical protein